MRLRVAFCSSLAVGMALVFAPGAGAVSFSNTEPVTIPGGAGNPSLYPSDVVVSGIPGPITDVDVSLNGFTNTFPDDIGVILVGPSGSALALFDCVGDGTDASGLDFTLDDSAATQLPNSGALTGGSFKPTGNCAAARSFPAPGPLTSYSYPGPQQAGTATLASTFNGQSANGTWSLFVRDFFAGGVGGFDGGWSLEVKPDPVPVTPLTPVTPVQTTTKKKCKKKKKGKKGAAAAKKCKKKPKKK